MQSYQKKLHKIWLYAIFAEYPIISEVYYIWKRVALPFN